ncbi:uncharacterized protein LOC135638626 [Musa acuminata AAA Group]|uniref:uncharacterized protein LOC135638626 n=1 Tax=Musa acuminata AAA Group TaxID=214697 RepID=UPI0031E3E83F
MAAPGSVAVIRNLQQRVRRREHGEEVMFTTGVWPAAPQTSRVCRIKGEVGESIPGGSSLKKNCNRYSSESGNTRHLMHQLLSQEGFYGNYVYPMGIQMTIVGSSPMEVIELIRDIKEKMSAKFLDWSQPQPHNSR